MGQVDLGHRGRVFHSDTTSGPVVGVEVGPLFARDADRCPSPAPLGRHRPERALHKLKPTEAVATRPGVHSAWDDVCSSRTVCVRSCAAYVREEEEAT